MLIAPFECSELASGWRSCHLSSQPLAPLSSLGASSVILMAVVIGLVVGSFVALLGRAGIPSLPPLPVGGALLVGALGSILGPLVWELVGLAIPDFIAQLGGALIALDLYLLYAYLA